MKILNYSNSMRLEVLGLDKNRIGDNNIYSKKKQLTMLNKTKRIRCLQKYRMLMSRTIALRLGERM